MNPAQKQLRVGEMIRLQFGPQCIVGAKQSACVAGFLCAAHILGQDLMWRIMCVFVFSVESTAQAYHIMGWILI